MGPLTWTDTHCHLDADEFEADGNAVVARARAAGVVQMVLPAVATAHFERVQTLAHQHGLAYALGVHPLQTQQATDTDLLHLKDALSSACTDPRLVAVGEIGLDHFVDGSNLERQAHFYAAQLALAREFELPVILHVRRSADALLQQLRKVPVQGGIAHAFNGSLQQALMFVKLGFKLGFGGTLTFERARQIRRLAQALPLEAIVLETDAPDMPPHWLYCTAAQRAAGSTSRNEPSELPRIAAVLAELRGMPLAELAQATSANACAALPKLGLLRTVDPSL
jgi:TatD DNase family protein